MNNISIITTNNYHLFKKLNDNYPQTIILSTIDDLPEIKTEILFDLTLFKSKEKIKLIRHYNKNNKLKIITDISCIYQDISEYNNIIAKISSAFYSPKNTFEAFCPLYNNQELIESFFKKLEFSILFLKQFDLGFIYPRVISMIINEAFFSLEDNLASKENIDNAMKAGVAYPLGPFKWAEKIGTPAIVYLLEEFLDKTGDPRYNVSKLLKQKL